jgi:hypothetical protein
MKAEMTAVAPHTFIHSKKENDSRITELKWERCVTDFWGGHEEMIQLLYVSSIFDRVSF